MLMVTPYIIIKKLLEKYTQEELARILDISLKSVYNYANGQNPSKRTYKKMLQIFKMLESGNAPESFNTSMKQEFSSEHYYNRVLGMENSINEIKDVIIKLSNQGLNKVEKNKETNKINSEALLLNFQKDQCVPIKNNKENLNNSFSRKMKLFRIENNLSQEEMATKLGMTQQNYSSIERGRSKIKVDFLEHWKNVTQEELKEEKVNLDINDLNCIYEKILKIVIDQNEKIECLEFEIQNISRELKNLRNLAV